MTFIKYLLVILSLPFALVGFAQETTIYNSPLSYETTQEKLKDILQLKGLVNDSFKMAEYNQDTSELQIRVSTYDFVDPYIVNSIVACEPTAAIDMPFRIVVWSEDKDVYIAYVDPIWLKRRFMIRDCDDVLGDYSKLLLRIVNETIRVD